MKINNKEQFHRYSISLYDFEEAKRFLTEAQLHKADSILYESLLIAAIIYFARPFSGNEDTKRFNEKKKRSDEEKKLFNDISRISINSLLDISSEEMAMYTDLMTLRNKCLAHAEFQYYPTSLNEKTGGIRSRRFSILDSHIDINVFSGLLVKLINQAHNKRADYIFALKNT